MNINRIVICISLSLVTLLSSCIDEIDHMEQTKKVTSEYIVFGGTTANDVVITRSGSNPTTKLTEKVLKSDTQGLSLPLLVKVQQGVDIQKPATRAAITTTIEEITQLDAWGTKNTYTDATKTQVTKRELFFSGSDGKAETGALFTKEAGSEDLNDDGVIDDIFYPDGNGPYLWEKNASAVSDFNFVTVSPAGSGFKAVINQMNYAVTFDYEIPTAAADQKDILVAVPDPVNVDYGAPVPLDYKHVMAAVNVKVGTKMPAGVIKSIQFKGVYDKASYYPATNEWTNRSVKENGGVFNVTLPEGGLVVGPDAVGNAITTAETSFMMIPQQLFTGAELVVEFHDNQTNKDVVLKTSIQGDLWAQNTTTNYLININANYNVSIVPLDKVLDSHYIITKVSISSDCPYWELEAISSDAYVTVQLEEEVNPMAKLGFWTDKYAKAEILYDKDGNPIDINYYVPSDAEYARGENKCSGSYTTNQIVYVFIPENISGKTREITLQLLGTDGTPEGTVIKPLILKQESVKWMQDPDDATSYWGCELLLEGGLVPWGFYWENVREEWRIEGRVDNQPPGWIDKINDAMAMAGLDVNSLYDENSPIRIIERKGHKSKYLIYIDYGMLGRIDIADDPFDGEINTKDLYGFEGINVISSIKDFLLSASDVEHVPGTFTGEINTLDYAAMYAMKRNRFNLYVADVDGDDMYIPVIDVDKDLNWYLPAKNQFPHFVDLNWGQSFSFNDLFWTSTASISEDDNSHAYAYLNGIETLTKRNEQYLTFALRRYSNNTSVDIPVIGEVIKPGGNNGPEYDDDDNDDENTGGSIGGGVGRN